MTNPGDNPAGDEHLDDQAVELEDVDLTEELPDHDEAEVEQLIADLGYSPEGDLP